MNKIKPIHIPSNTQKHSNSNDNYIPDTKEEKDDGFAHYRNSFLCNPKISNKAKATMVKREVKEYV